MESTLMLDQQVTLWLNQHSPAFMDPFWVFMSQVRVWFPFYALILVFLFWKLGWKKGLVTAAALILTVVITDQFSVYVKDTLVQRLRPCHTPWMLENGLRMPDGVHPSQYGFFSGHACNSFGFATLVVFILKYLRPSKANVFWAWGLMIWATLQALSRIVLGAHFLGDILVGSLVGLLIGWLMALICKAVCRRMPGLGRA